MDETDERTGGESIITALKLDIRTLLIPIILLSARRGKIPEKETGKAKPDDYLAKGFERRELFARVRANLELAQLRSLIVTRKSYRQEIREQLHLFDIALSNTPDFTYLFDCGGRFIYANRPLLELWQKPIGEVIGQNFYDLSYPPELAERLQRQIAHVVTTKEVLRDRTRFAGPTGEVRFYEYIFVPVLEPGGHVRAVAGSTRDITSQVHAEDEREREGRERELARLESLGLMAGGIAHRFNNLLTAISGNVSLAAHELPPRSSCMPLLEEAIAASERAAQLARQMLAYSEKTRLSLAPVNLSALAAESAASLEGSIPKTVRLILDITRGLPFIEGDRGHLRHMIVDLIRNAVESLEEQPGKVTIGTRAVILDADTGFLFGAGPLSGPYVSLQVSDTGSGMDEGTLDRIFEPFFTTRFFGRGLGLAEVQGVVRMHGGAIRVSSRREEGSVFEIFFPAA